jgi:hypothetical protein
MAREAGINGLKSFAVDAAERRGSVRLDRVAWSLSNPTDFGIDFTTWQEGRGLVKQTLGNTCVMQDSHMNSFFARFLSKSIDIIDSIIVQLNGQSIHPSATSASDQPWWCLSHSRL